MKSWTDFDIRRLISIVQLQLRKLNDLFKEKNKTIAKKNRSRKDVWQQYVMSLTLHGTRVETTVMFNEPLWLVHCTQQTTVKTMWQHLHVKSLIIISKPFQQPYILTLVKSWHTYTYIKGRIGKSITLSKGSSSSSYSYAGPQHGILGRSKTSTARRSSCPGRHSPYVGPGLGCLLNLACWPSTARLRPARSSPTCWPRHDGPDDPSKTLICYHIFPIGQSIPHLSHSSSSPPSRRRTHFSVLTRRRTCSTPRCLVPPLLTV